MDTSLSNSLPQSVLPFGSSVGEMEFSTLGRLFEITDVSESIEGQGILEQGSTSVPLLLAPKKPVVDFYALRTPSGSEIGEGEPNLALVVSQPSFYDDRESEENVRHLSPKVGLSVGVEDPEDEETPPTTPETHTTCDL